MSRVVNQRRRATQLLIAATMLGWTTAQSNLANEESDDWNDELLRVCDYDDLVTEFTECNAGSRHGKQHNFTLS